MSSRNIPSKASLKRWAMFDAGCVPKPSLHSDTKKSVLPLSSLCVAVVRNCSSSWRKTMPSFHQSSGAIAN
eukprot:843073-Pleurochrysis_carterae.AAC.1